MSENEQYEKNASTCRKLTDSGIVEDDPDLIRRNIRWHIAAFRHTKTMKEKKQKQLQKSTKTH